MGQDPDFTKNFCCFSCPWQVLTYMCVCMVDNNNFVVLFVSMFVFLVLQIINFLRSHAHPQMLRNVSKNSTTLFIACSCVY